MYSDDTPNTWPTDLKAIFTWNQSNFWLGPLITTLWEQRLHFCCVSCCVKSSLCRQPFNFLPDPEISGGPGLPKKISNLRGGGGPLDPSPVSATAFKTIKNIKFCVFITSQIYPGFYHKLLNEPKEDAALVINDILSWLSQRVPWVCK